MPLGCSPDRRFRLTPQIASVQSAWEVEIFPPTVPDVITVAIQPVAVEFRRREDCVMVFVEPVLEADELGVREEIRELRDQQ